MSSRSTTNSCLKQLVKLKFDNEALKILPVDKSMRPGSRRVTGACFSLVEPTPVENPKLVVMSASAMKLLDVDEKTATEKELADYFSGNKKLPGSVTASHCYCGHQFGAFAGQLGDGAAIYLGEVVNNNGNRWEIQIKGAGHTPYSRSGDGRKVLRSSIREFLCSEAMHHLGVPTTRAGTLVTSDSLITRDMFYDGRPRREKCSIVLRIAQTFLRFGSFEIFKPEDEMTGRAGPSVGRNDILRQMLDYSIDKFYPHIRSSHPESNEDCYLKFYEEVCVKTAYLVASWQCVGFCHGVLNTDNMNIVGLTIDYGPYGFLDCYDPDFICNMTDENGRYTFKKQPEICFWNLKKFAEAIKEAIPLERSLAVLNEVYHREFNSFYINKMRLKFGLVKQQLEEDEALVRDFLSTMENTRADFTNSFRNLSILSLPGLSDHEESQKKLLVALLEGCSSLEGAKMLSKPSFSAEQLQSLKQLVEQNPGFLLMIGGADGPIKREIEKAEAFEKINEMTEDTLLASNTEKWKSWLSKYTERLRSECENVDDIAALDKTRKRTMNSNNPKYILRNFIAQNAIEEAEKGNYLEVRNLLHRLEHPYDDDNDKSSPHFGFNNVLYNSLPPPSATALRVS